MKCLYPFWLVCFFSCGSTAIDPSGTYIRHSQHKFGEEWDTLIVVHEHDDFFRIIRKWQYTRVLDNKFMPPTFEVKEFAAIQNKDFLIDDIRQLRYHIENGGQSIRLGKTIYLRQ